MSKEQSATIEVEDVNVSVDYEGLCAELQTKVETLERKNAELERNNEQYINQAFGFQTKAKELQDIANISIGYIQQLECIIEHAKLTLEILTGGKKVE